MPIQYSRITITDYDTNINEIDIEYNKANSNLSCNTSSDKIENMNLINMKDLTYKALSIVTQNKLKLKYKRIITNCSNVKKLLMIGIPHGGTTWFQKRLSKHKYIDIYGEKLFDWTINHCNGHITSNNEDLCNWNTLKSILDTFYVYKFTKKVRSIFYRKQCNVNIKKAEDVKLYYIGFKITIWQIMPTMYGEFVRWIYCNKVSVIQLFRSAVINSFWGEQAMSFETIFYGRKFGRIKKIKNNKYIQHENNTKYIVDKESFNLDPYFSEQYVRNTQFWMNTLENLLRYHRKSIHFIKIFYEDLIGQYSNFYENSIQTFLGVILNHKVLNSKNNKNAQLERLHPIPCYKKIKNWQNDVKQRLIDTASYYACEKDNS